MSDLARRYRRSITADMSARDEEVLYRGFESALRAVDDENEPIGGRALALFEEGQRLGQRCREVIGSQRVEPALRNTAPLHKKAIRTHESVIRMIKKRRLPRDKEDNAIRAARLEPCAACNCIGICAESQMTCARFRSYVSRDTGGKAMIPDKTWSESFKECDSISEAESA